MHASSGKYVVWGLAFVVLAAICVASFSTVTAQMMPERPMIAPPMIGPAGTTAPKVRPTVENPTIEKAQKLMQQGNFNEAFEAYRILALDPKTDPKQVGNCLQNGLQCLQRLNRANQTDAFREDVIKVHENNWRLLFAAARSLRNEQHYGFMIGGKFERGHHRGGGQVMNCEERDRVRMLQLMAQAVPLAQQDSEHRAVSDFFRNFADMWMGNRGYTAAWMLQDLTDLDVLPDYEPGYSSYYHGQTQGAPVDEEGNPIFYDVPPTFDAAENDGQRWRWCLEQVVEYSPVRRDEVVSLRADFLQQQFGVQTMQAYGFFFGRMQTDDTQDVQKGRFALQTLKSSETLARLATGVKRFELPDEHNFIKMYEQLASNPNSNYTDHAIRQLGSIFENRRQYPAAAEWYRTGVSRYPGNDYMKQRLNQIVGAWGMLEPAIASAEGKDSGAAEFEYRFRNGTEVTFTAHEIDVEKLLADVKEYIQSRPTQIDYNKVNIQNLGHRLIVEGQNAYLSKEPVAKWNVKLDPRPEHFDRRITVDTPLQNAGAYLLKTEMKDGNTCYIVLWKNDTAIVRKPLDGRAYYYIADAESGEPVAKANVEFFGWRQFVRDYRANPRVYEIETKNFAEYSDADGQLMLDQSRVPNNLQWLVIARTKDGRFAYTGFEGVWFGRKHDQEYNQTKVFTITDRPVYRPEQTVHYKFWARHAQYDMGDVSDFAGAQAKIEIRNPRGDVIQETNVKLDEYGGIEGELDLPEDATLGVYNMRFHIQNRVSGHGSFRVEEYKKPEFEVTVDAPSDPVMLGETVTATVNAKYYFGEPVREGKVKYTVKRTEHSDSWYPIRPWDWLYGSGYWWFAYDCPWYPGWREWGCVAPTPIWWHRPSAPPEVVLERTVDIGEDGTVKIDIDTELAKVLHPNQDQKYSISVEVTDQSRRTILGSGNVLVARKPFKVYAWTDRGYYRTDEVIRAEFQARRLDGKAVTGKGEAVLYKTVIGEDGVPTEQELYTKDIDTDDEGRAKLLLRAARSGQYRIAYTLTDAAGHSIEGGHLFTIVGPNDDTADYRYNSIELVPEKAEYAPGETVRMQVNVNKANATVLLFPRPSNGVYLPPKVMRLNGKSAEIDIDVVQRDMPNFFVEAVTIADGRVHSVTREIVVPPEKRILNVEVEPSSETYKPGEKATVNVRLTDIHGEPFVGSTVISIYDKSVEYISGGSNVGDIKEFFWKWRRHHNPSTSSNLERRTHQVTPRNVKTMQFLGVFGRSVADDMETVEDSSGEVMDAMAFGGGGGYGGMARGAMAKGMAMGAPMPAMAMADAAPMESMAFAEGGEMAGAMPAPGLPPAPNGGAPAFVEATVRKNFADTALWVGSLTTKSDGTAQVELDMPENLTTWRIKVWGMGQGTRVGEGTTDVITRKGLILRMQTPRFFVQTDEVVLSANVHNYLETEKTAQIAIETDGGVLKLLDEPTRQAQIPAGGETRIDWRVKVLEPGDAVVRMKALTDEESDAMEMTLESLVHGMLKQEAVSGSLRPDEEAGKFTIRVPAERRPEQTRLEVRYSPTLAGAMVDALPYLLDYPYGCTEQTLNRFVPAVVTQKVLLDMGLDLETIAKTQTNLNAQELGTHEERSAQWKHYKRNPVFSQAEMQKIVKEGVDRLTQMQCSDGGWGWFSGYGEHSTPHTTATVVHGLQVAQSNDVALVPGVLDRGVAWLERHQDEQVKLLKTALLPPEERKGKRYKTQADNVDALVYMVLVDAGKDNVEMRDFLYRDRTKNSVYALSMLGLALEKQGEKQMLNMVMRNIGQYVIVDRENQTAYLDLPGGYWWYWYGSEYEAHAYYLKLLSKVEPKGELAPMLVKYLLNNRKHATYWNSTRDTALCVEAMADFLVASGENRPDMTVEVWYDGELKQAVEITPETLFKFNNAFVLEGVDVTDGEHVIELRKKGTGPLYYNGYLTNFTLEDPITKAGLEIKVERKFYRLTLDEDATAKVAGGRGQVIEQRIEKYVREPLADLSTLKSGDLVEIELEIESKNDYESIVFEDMKAAGFEPVEVRSGYNGNAMRAYVEFRDERVVFFVHRLARGKHSVSYRMKAEIPGRFSALPTKAWAMYAPELKANSDEFKVRVED